MNSGTPRKSPRTPELADRHHRPDGVHGDGRGDRRHGLPGVELRASKIAHGLPFGAATIATSATSWPNTSSTTASPTPPSSISYMATAFKKLFGLTPGRYRESRRGKPEDPPRKSE